VTDRAAHALALLTERGWTLGLAESLTGGALADAFVRVPGASAALSGAIVAYATPLKSALLGVDPELLHREGPVHPEVARQMAAGARRTLAVEGRPADVGLATTGVAGPEPQGGRPPGTVFVGVAVGGVVRAVPGAFAGDRATVRAAAVGLALDVLLDVLASE
jgi:nicotinamide-nucleotide amidase